MTLTQARIDLTSSAPDVAPPPTDERPQRQQPGLNASTLALCAVFLALFAFLAAIFAIGLASRAVDAAERRTAAPAATAAVSPGAKQVKVTLTEFTITPDPIELASGGGTIELSNTGSVVHNVKVGGKQTPDIASGATATLDLTGLADGTYTIICTVPGHLTSGMKAQLTIG
jgi:uncharacterized cupredoxin-like copper-binding protein